MIAYLLAGALALGGYGGWRVTTWAYDADYKARVEDMAQRHNEQVKASEKLIRESLLKEQKTKIVYRTIKEKVHETRNDVCFDDIAISLHREATARANNTEADELDDRVRKTPIIINWKKPSNPDEPH